MEDTLDSPVTEREATDSASFRSQKRIRFNRYCSMVWCNRQEDLVRIPLEGESVKFMAMPISPQDALEREKMTLVSREMRENALRALLREDTNGNRPFHVSHRHSDVRVCKSHLGIHDCLVLPVMDDPMFLGWLQDYREPTCVCGVTVNSSRYSDDFGSRLTGTQ